MDRTEQLYSPPENQETKRNSVSNYYVLEYSSSQDAFHIETLSEMIAANSESFTRGRLNDFVPIAMHRRRERLEQTIQRLKQRGT